MKKSAFKLLILPFLIFGIAFFLWQRFAPRSSWNTPTATPVAKWKVHKFPVRLLAWTSDEKIISGDDKIVFGWDAKTGQTLTSFKPLKSSYDAALSSDGRWLAIRRKALPKRQATWQADRYKYASIEAQQGKRATLPDTKKAKMVTKLMYKGRGFDIWDLKQRRVVHKLNFPDDEPGKIRRPYAPMFSLDGKTLCAKANYSNNVGDDWEFNEEWWGWKDFQSAPKLLKARTSAKAEISSVLAFRNRSPQVVFAPRKSRETSPFEPSLRELRMVDLFTKHSLSLPMEETKATPSPYSNRNEFDWRPVAFSPSGNLLVGIKSEGTTGGYYYSGSDKTIYLWDVTKKQLLWKHYEDRFGAEMLSFSPDAKLLAAAGMNYQGTNAFSPKGKVLVFNIATGKPQEFSEETQNDRAQQTWMKQEYAINEKLGRNTTRRAPKLAPGDSGEVTSLAWSPDSKKLAAGYYDGSIKIWQVR